MNDEKQSWFSKYFTTVLHTLATLGTTSAVILLFKLKDDMAELKFREEVRSHKVQTIDNNVQLIMGDFKLMKERDFQDIKDRLKTLEIKMDK